MIEAAQARAARALIGWSQTRLAETAGVPLSIVERFETGAPDLIAANAADKMRTALEAAGVVFTPKNGGGGVGVRLREALEGDISAGTTSTPRTTSSGPRPRRRAELAA
jgi:transcriptional regulator with XRE-family HTH domain